MKIAIIWSRTGVGKLISFQKFGEFGGKRYPIEIKVIDVNVDDANEQP